MPLQLRLVRRLQRMSMRKSSKCVRPAFAIFSRNDAFALHNESMCVGERRCVDREQGVLLWLGEAEKAGCGSEAVVRLPTRRGVEEKAGTTTRSQL